MIPGITCGAGKKPGAPAHGDPFRNWDLPLALAQILPTAGRP